MLIQVHNATVQANPRRILAAAIFLIGFSAFLAASLTWHRGSHPMGRRYQARQWGVSFQLPRGWKDGLPEHIGTTTAIPFHGLTRSGAYATIAVWRFRDMINSQPAEICASILGQPLDTLRERAGRMSGSNQRTKMGTYDAFELFGSERRTVVRATHGPTGDVYAVSYRVDGTPIDEHGYNLFDLTCRSIRYDGN